MRGRFRGGVRFGDLPEAAEPGDVWRYVGEDGQPLSARAHANGADPASPVHGNLTDEMWGYYVPNGRGMGTLVLHTVRYHPEDGTVSVRPGDGSSNSIGHGPRGDGTYDWHGFVEHCEWREV